MCFGGSLRILFGLDLSSFLYYRGLHSGRSTPVLRMLIRYIPIVRSSSIVLGGVYSYRALRYI